MCCVKILKVWRTVAFLIIFVSISDRYIWEYLTLCSWLWFYYRVSFYFEHYRFISLMYIEELRKRLSFTHFENCYSFPNSWNLRSSIKSICLLIFQLNSNSFKRWLFLTLTLLHLAYPSWQQFMSRQHQVLCGRSLKPLKYNNGDTRTVPTDGDMVLFFESVELILFWIIFQVLLFLFLKIFCAYLDVFFFCNVERNSLVVL